MEDKGNNSDQRRWYMIHTHTGRESQVEVNLKQRIKSIDAGQDVFQVMIPKVEEIEI